MTLKVSESAETVDLLDAAANRIEHVRSMAWNLAERLDHLLGRGVVGAPLVGELNALHDLATEAQEVLETLTRRECKTSHESVAIETVDPISDGA